MQINDQNDDFYYPHYWWNEELTLDERKDLSKAWVILKQEGKVSTGPKAQVRANIIEVFTYLKKSDNYYADRLSIQHGSNDLKWKQIHNKMQALTRGKTDGFGKGTPYIPRTRSKKNETEASPVEDTTTSSPDHPVTEKLKTSLLGSSEQSQDQDDVSSSKSHVPSFKTEAKKERPQPQSQPRPSFQIEERPDVHMDDDQP